MVKEVTGMKTLGILSSWNIWRVQVQKSYMIFVIFMKI